MTNDDAFLQALQTSPRDDAPRLIYADWLDEQGDPRGEYLRVQCELARTWFYYNQRADLFVRLAALRTKIDSAWLARVRRCTTPRPPIDITTVLPGLKRLGKTTVCLHPRPGNAALDASKIGGSFLWPATEEWPMCNEHQCSYVTALQLRKDDVPELHFPRGKDLFQVLWCPRDHEPGYCPAVATFWRKRAAIHNPLEAPPVPANAERSYVPQPCVLHPERVLEYPDPAEESAPLERLDEFEELEIARNAVVSAMAPARWELPNDVSRFYQCWLSTADGTKVGGYPDWVQDPEYPTCSCGTLMEQLIMFSSREFDGATWGRWCSIEDRDALGADWTRLEAVQTGADWMFGDAGNLYLFHCRVCKSRPVRALLQCS